MIQWLKCFFKGHKWNMIASYLVDKVEGYPASYGQCTCIIMRCEDCRKIKEKKLKGIVEIPEYAMRE